MERCPVCSRHIPSNEIVAHVNFCLDDVQLGRDRAPSGSWSVHMMEANDALRQRSAVELDLHNVPRSELLGTNYSLERIDLNSRGGGVVFVRVLGIDRHVQPLPSDSHGRSSCFPSFFSRHLPRLPSRSCLQLGNSSLFCALEYESVDWKTKPTRPVVCPDDSKFSQFYIFDKDVIVPIHDFYGPLTLCVDAFKSQVFRSPTLYGRAQVRLYDARSHQKVLLDKVTGVLSIDDPILLTKKLSEMLETASRRQLSCIHSASKKGTIKDTNTLPGVFSSDSRSLIAALFSAPKLYPLRVPKLNNRKTGTCANIWLDVSYFGMEPLVHHRSAVSSLHRARPMEGRHSLPTQPPLMHIVSLLDSSELANFVIAHGNYQSGFIYAGRTAVHLAALCGHVRVLRELVMRDESLRREDFDFNFGLTDDAHRLDAHNLSALHYAVLGAELHNRASEIIALLNDNLVNIADSEGRTPLMLLCSRSQHVHQPCLIASRLVEMGANPLSRDRHGDTPLIACTRNGNLELMQFLISANSHALNMYNNAGKHPLTVASEICNFEAVSLLLEHKALPWASPLDGQSPLHLLAAKAQVDIANLLCKAMKNKSISKLGEMLLLRDHDGRMARHIAQNGCTAEHKKMLHLLQTYHSLVEGKCDFEPSGSLMSAATDETYMYFETLSEVQEYKEGESDEVPLEKEPDMFQEESAHVPYGIDIHRRNHSIIADAVFEEEAAASEHIRQMKEVASVLQAMVRDDCSAKPELQVLERPLHVPISTAARLLRHFRWNMDKLLTSFSENALETCEAAGMTLRTVPLHPASQDNLKEESKIFKCPICMEEYADGGFSLACGHRFNESCWKGYLRAKIAGGPSCVFATCPAANCREVVPEDAWKHLLAKYPEHLERYSFFLVRSYIELNPSLKWCPSPKCNKAVMYTGEEAELRCHCGFKMCFQCSEAAHSPANCDMARRWRIELESDGSTADLIVKTARLCPSCSVPISRISGCNHIRCMICDHEFCYLCCGPWASHGDATGGFYECNLFNATEVDSQTRSQALGRYVHYYTRFQHHRQAQTSAIEARRIVSAKLLSEREPYQQMKLSECVAAFYELEESRRILAFSYVFAYYLPDEAQKHLFEHLQEMLEKHAEYLHEMVIPIAESVDVDVSLERVRNFTHLTRQFARNLLGSVEQHFGQNPPGHTTASITVPTSPQFMFSCTNAQSPHSRSASGSSNTLPLSVSTTAASISTPSSNNFEDSVSRNSSVPPLGRSRPQQVGASPRLRSRPRSSSNLVLLDSDGEISRNDAA